ncbi:neuronal acetylcholine receptor subunit alpha-6-like [Mytilus edulis]|uniref:neuronal acetylcholine receptor subunit alpha-6-like n=1 Tax=Mytilus edulis TaxID=6550 RepID=UPI0039EDEA5F
MIRWIFLFSVFGRTVCQSNTDVQNLLTQLFTTNSYNYLIRPSTDQSVTKEVYISFTLYGITGIDEIEQKLTTTGWLEIHWQDDLLSWTPSSYGGLQELYVPQGNIWKPDISLQNGFSDLKELGSKFIQVNIQSDGQVTWRPFQVFSTKCSLDSTYFPFDRQTCDLVFVAWSLDRHDVFLAQYSDGIDISEELQSHGEWEIITSSATDEVESYETKVKFTIVIQRKPLFVIMNFVLPIILLSLLDIFTFKIPADIGERLGYTITVWLSFAVFLTIVSASLPQSSETVPIMSVYIIIQLVMGTLIVLIFDP